MTRTFECMFLIDNDVVRAGWNEAKAGVASLIEKHGGSTTTARRWDERRLAYPIKHRNRATYLLAFCELAPERIDALRMDLDLSESVLRYLLTSVDTIPAEETELAAAESSDEFVVPEPPADDAPAEPVVAEAEAEAKPEAAAGEAAPAAAEGEETKAPAEAPAAEAATETETETETETVAAAKTDGEEA